RVAFAQFEIGHVVSVHAKGLHCHLARKSRTISQYLCGACSNIACVAPAIVSIRESGTCAASACSTFGKRPLLLAPPMNRAGALIFSASDLENGVRSLRASPIRVVALSRKSCLDAAGSRFQGAPSAVRNSSSPPSISPLAISPAAAAIGAAMGHGPGL